jgi:predicted DCC family thiol-disulfide oxidoreductase YuxK
MLAESSPKYVLAYDTDCGPCTRFAHVVDILDRHERIDFIALTKADQKGLLDKILALERFKSFHLISTNGQVKSGPEALLELIRLLSGGKAIFVVISHFPAGKQIVRFVYNRFSRLHDTGSCSANNNNELHLP